MSRIAALLDQYRLEDQQEAEEFDTELRNENSNLASELESIKSRDYVLDHSDLVGVAPHLRAKVQEGFANDMRMQDETSARQGYFEFERQARGLALEKATRRREAMQKLIQFSGLPAAAFDQVPRDPSLRTAIVLNPSTNTFEQQPRGNINETQTRIKEIAQHYGVGEDVVTERLVETAEAAAKARASEESADRARRGLKLKEESNERARIKFDQEQADRKKKAATKEDTARLDYQLENTKKAKLLDPNARAQIFLNPEMYTRREQEVAERSLELEQAAYDLKLTDSTHKIAQRLFISRKNKYDRDKIANPDMVLPPSRQLWSEALADAQELKGFMGQYHKQQEIQEQKKFGPGGAMELAMHDAHQRTVQAVQPTVPDPRMAPQEPEPTDEYSQGLGALLGGAPEIEEFVPPSGILTTPFESPIAQMGRSLRGMHLGANIPGPMGVDAHTHLERLLAERGQYKTESPLQRHVRRFRERRTRRGGM